MRSEPVLQIPLLLQPTPKQRLNSELRFGPRQRSRKRVAAFEESVDGRQRDVVDQPLCGSDGASVEGGDAAGQLVDECV